MGARDGDGWIQCACGYKHWGKHGAAGIMLIRNGEVFLQHRAPWVHNGDTWGIPGGARDSHETIIEGAIREAVEETGIKPEDLQPVHTLLPQAIAPTQAIGQHCHQAPAQGIFCVFGSAP